MNCVTIICTFLLLALPLGSYASASITLYRGEMELVAISGGGCTEKDKAGSRLPLELLLELGSSSPGQKITGYFNGPDMQRGRFSGSDLGRMQVVYPDNPGFQGDFLSLSTTPGGLEGELHEKTQADSTNCYFEKAVVRLKQVASGSRVESEYLRQRDLFSADAYFLSGQSLLKEDKPEKAIPELTKSLDLRNKVNPKDPDKAAPVVAIAIAQIMNGREAKALALMRELLGDKSGTGDAIVRQRMAVSGSICNDEQYLESYAGHTAALQLMDTVAREFGPLDGVAVPLAACYYEMAREQKEQDDPDGAIVLFKKSLKLNPENPDSIAGIAMSLVDKEAPAEGRRYLNEHAKNFLKTAGKEPYDSLLSYLYAAEAQQDENDGDLSRAEELSREAVKVRPGERTLIIALTRVLGKEGKSTQARRLLEEGRNGCRDEACRQEYSDEIARQDMIERLVKRLENKSGE